MTNTYPFTNKASYMTWVEAWKADYAALSLAIRAEGPGWIKMKLRRQATAMLEQRRDAKVEAQRLFLLAREQKLRDGVAAHMAAFPLAIGACASLDLYFNKMAIQHPGIIPRWVIRTRGQTYYVRHIDCQAGWSSRELEDGPTLGMIRLKRVSLHIDADGHATVEAMSDQAIAA